MCVHNKQQGSHQHTQQLETSTLYNILLHISGEGREREREGGGVDRTLLRNKYSNRLEQY